jgi:hypothetical protein
MTVGIDREECRKCGKTWGVTMTPREDVICSDCSHTPRLPEGEVRRDDDGTIVVCLGGDAYLRWQVIGGDAYLRWQVIGEDPHRISMHGWRADHHVVDCERIGNVHDLMPGRHAAERNAPAPQHNPKFIDVELPLDAPDSKDQTRD